MKKAAWIYSEEHHKLQLLLLKKNKNNKRISMADLVREILKKYEQTSQNLETVPTNKA